MNNKKDQSLTKEKGGVVPKKRKKKIVPSFFVLD